VSVTPRSLITNLVASFRGYHVDIHQFFSANSKERAPACRSSQRRQVSSSLLHL